MPDKKPLIIVCGGGFAREVIWLARDCSAEWDIMGILDDTPSLQGQEICGIPVLGTIDCWPTFSGAWFVVAVGSPRNRRIIVTRMESRGPVKFATLIHPTALLSDYVKIKEGSIITARCILTTQIELGRHTIVNLACTIGHDVITGDFCTLAPQVALSGNVTLGHGVEIGTGAAVIEKLTIGTGTLIGAGSLLTKTCPDNVLAVGIPARQIKNLESFELSYYKNP